MVDGVLLLVDASEGPLPQTRFVLRKALELGLPPIVVINKIDRQDARPQEVLNEVYDLFIDLDAHRGPARLPGALHHRPRGHLPRSTPDGPDEHARSRCSRRSCAPSRRRATTRTTPLQMLVAQPRLRRLRRPPGDRPHRQRHACARGRTSRWCRLDGTRRAGRAVTQPLRLRGPRARRGRRGAGPGDIVALAGFAEVNIGETHHRPRGPARRCRTSIVDEPTVTMVVPASTPRRSPAARASYVTSRKLRERLEQGAAHQRRDPRRADRHAGRLQGLGPRRAAAGHPHRDDAARGLRAVGRQARGHHPRDRRRQRHEPMEQLVIDCPEEYVGVVTQKLGTPPRPHDQDGQPRHRPRAPGVPHPVARPDRLPQPSSSPTRAAPAC